MNKVINEEFEHITVREILCRATDVLVRYSPEPKFIRTFMVKYYGKSFITSSFFKFQFM